MPNFIFLSLLSPSPPFPPFLFFPLRQEFSMNSWLVWKYRPGCPWAHRKPFASARIKGMAHPPFSFLPSLPSLPVSRFLCWRWLCVFFFLFSLVAVSSLILSSHLTLLISKLNFDDYHPMHLLVMVRSRLWVVPEVLCLVVLNSHPRMYRCLSTGLCWSLYILICLQSSFPRAFFS